MTQELELEAKQVVGKGKPISGEIRLVLPNRGSRIAEKSRFSSLEERKMLTKKWLAKYMHQSKKVIYVIHDL